jgi:RHS repeat-associated protein
MGFEEDRTHFAGSFGPNIDCDVTANALGARGIDRIQKYVRSSTDWGMSWTRSASSSDVFVYPLYDAHGNMVRTLSKTTNGYTVSAETVVDPWGTKVSSGTGEKRDYCASIGHVTDDESGMVYMRARFYEPGMGRFVSQDTAMDGINWFAYCDSQPVNQSDYSGKEMSPEAKFANVLGWFGFLVGFLLDQWEPQNPAGRALKNFVQGTLYGVSLAEKMFSALNADEKYSMAKAALIGAGLLVAGVILTLAVRQLAFWVMLISDNTENNPAAGLSDKLWDFDPRKSKCW